MVNILLQRSFSLFLSNLNNNYVIFRGVGVQTHTAKCYKYADCSSL